MEDGAAHKLRALRYGSTESNQTIIGHRTSTEVSRTTTSCWRSLQLLLGY